MRRCRRWDQAKEIDTRRGRVRRRAYPSKRRRPGTPIRPRPPSSFSRPAPFLGFLSLNPIRPPHFASSSLGLSAFIMAASTEAPAFAPTSLPLSNAYASRDLPVCPSPTSPGSSPSQLTFPISPLDPRLFSIDGPRLQTPNPSSWPKPRLVTGGHRDPVQCVAWNSEGKKLVSSSSGAQGVRVWDVGSNGASVSDAGWAILGGLPGVNASWAGACCNWRRGLAFPEGFLCLLAKP